MGREISNCSSTRIGSRHDFVRPKVDILPPHSDDFMGNTPWRELGILGLDGVHELSGHGN